MRRIKLVLALAAVLVATLVATAGPAMADNDRLRCNERERNDNDTIVCNERGDRDDREVFVEADEFFDEFGFPIFVVLQRQSKTLTRMRSWTRLPVVCSTISGSACRFNSYDERCKKHLLFSLSAS